MPRPVDQHMRRKILSAAADLFFANGFFKVTITELVTTLRTSKSSIYKHFASKEAIVEVLLDEFNAEVDRKLEQIVTDETADFRKKFEAVTACTCQVLARVQRPFFRDLQIHTPNLRARYEEARQRRLDRFYRSLFVEGKRQSVIRKDIDTDLILTMYTKMTEVLIDPDSMNHFSFSIKKAYEMITRLFLEGVLTDNAKK